MESGVFEHLTSEKIGKVTLLEVNFDTIIG